MVDIILDSGEGQTITLFNEGGTQGAPGAPGAPGQQGAPGAPGVGVPTGGTAGQYLRKGSGSNEWVDLPFDGPDAHFTGEVVFDDAPTFSADGFKIYDANGTLHRFFTGTNGAINSEIVQPEGSYVDSLPFGYLLALSLDDNPPPEPPGNFPLGTLYGLIL